MKPLDLFLGGDLGLWVLSMVDPKNIRRVFTLNTNIADTAIKRGIESYTLNANDVDFMPSASGFSIHYPRILKPHLLDRYEAIYNLHPGYLPWGRGYYPIFWAIWEESPAGATLHEINAEIDGGRIVAQKEVPYVSSDTGGSLFQRVRRAEKELFLEYWPRILKGETFELSSQVGLGSYHTKKEFFSMKEFANWKELDAQNLCKLIRALTFPGMRGLEIDLGDRRFEIQLVEIST